MQVLIRASKVSEKLGVNFRVYGSLNPTELVLSYLDLLGGYVLDVSENETKIIISPLDATNIPNFELEIDEENTISLTAENFSYTDYRPRDENTEIIHFREEIFPSEKMEEIEQLQESESVLIDYFNKSNSFTISYQETYEGLNIKIGSKEPFDTETNSPLPFFIFEKKADGSSPANLEIHETVTNTYYEVSKDEDAENFKIREYINSDILSPIFE
jgi:hypothetical protein